MHRSIFSSDKFNAYSAPIGHHSHTPQHFRVGSPFQKLIDISSEKDATRFNQFNVVNNYHIEQSALKDASGADLKQGEEKYVFCYFTNWAFYRKGDGKFVPENLDSSLCTHIIYSFSSLEADSLLLKEFDPWADVENGKKRT